MSFPDIGGHVALRHELRTISRSRGRRVLPTKITVFLPERREPEIRRINERIVGPVARIEEEPGPFLDQPATVTWMSKTRINDTRACSGRTVFVGHVGNDLVHIRDVLGHGSCKKREFFDEEIAILEPNGLHRRTPGANDRLEMRKRIRIRFWRRAREVGVLENEIRKVRRVLDGANVFDLVDIINEIVVRARKIGLRGATNLMRCRHLRIRIKESTRAHVKYLAYGVANGLQAFVPAHVFATVFDGIASVIKTNFVAYREDRGTRVFRGVVQHLVVLALAPSAVREHRRTGEQIIRGYVFRITTDEMHVLQPWSRSFSSAPIMVPAEPHFIDERQMIVNRVRAAMTHSESLRHRVFTHDRLLGFRDLLFIGSKIDIVVERYGVDVSARAESQRKTRKQGKSNSFHDDHLPWRRRRSVERLAFRLFGIRSLQSACHSVVAAF